MEFSEQGDELAQLIIESPPIMQSEIELYNNNSASDVAEMYPAVSIPDSLG